MSQGARIFQKNQESTGAFPSGNKGFMDTRQNVASGAKLFSGNIQQPIFQGQGQMLTNQQVKPSASTSGRNIFSSGLSHGHINSNIPKDQMMLDGATNQPQQGPQGMGSVNINQPQKSGKSIFGTSTGGNVSNIQQPVQGTQIKTTPNIFAAAASSTPNFFMQNFGQQNVFNPDNIFGSQNLLKQPQSQNVNTPSEMMSDDLMMEEDNLNYNYPQTSQLTQPSDLNKGNLPVINNTVMDISNNQNNITKPLNFENKNFSKISAQPQVNNNKPTSTPSSMSQTPQPTKKEIKTLEEFEDKVRRMFEIPKLTY
jgi:hypothetical protein